MFLVHRRRLVAAVLASATALTIVGVAASPVWAATLPEGQQIDAIRQNGPYVTVDPVTAALTVIDAPGTTQINGLDVDDTGHGYAVTGDLGTFANSTLYTVDATTGTLSVPTAMHIGSIDGPLAQHCYGLDYSAGVLVAACHVVIQGLDHPRIGVVDPATGVLTPSISIDAIQTFFAIARDPITGIYWGFAGTNQAFQLDLAGNAVVPAASTGPTVWAADFDRDGQLFVSASRLVITPPNNLNFIYGLHTLDPAVGPTALVADYSPTATVWALTIWGEGPPVPVLPVSGSTEPWTLGVAALLLALFGAGTVIVAGRKSEV